jgi:hypothetical protein
MGREVQKAGDGHSHDFLATFSTVQAHDLYLVHPDHAAFANWTPPFVSSVALVGRRAKFWAGHPTSFQRELEILVLN